MRPDHGPCVLGSQRLLRQAFMKGFTMQFEFLELNRDSWIWFEQLFLPTNGCDGCWCYNHHIIPGQPDVTGEDARMAFKELVEAGRARGIIALENGEPAGWCAVDKLQEIPGHDCINEQQLKSNDGWAVHCFYIRPLSRGKGLTRLLLEKSIKFVESQGGAFIEAYPTPPNDSGQILDFCGHYKIFSACGFKEKEAVNQYYTRLTKELGNRS